MRPSRKASWFTVKSGVVLDCCGAGAEVLGRCFGIGLALLGGAEGALLVARLEKFHCPLALRMRLTSGLSMLKPVMFRALEVISGNISTPTLNALARKNGDWLKLGSSAMESVSADSEPEKSDRLKLPICTLRP